MVGCGSNVRVDASCDCMDTEPHKGGAKMLEGSMAHDHFLVVIPPPLLLWRFVGPAGFSEDAASRRSVTGLHEEVRWKWLDIFFSTTLSFEWFGPIFLMESNQWLSNRMFLLKMFFVGVFWPIPEDQCGIRECSMVPHFLLVIASSSFRIKTWWVPPDTSWHIHNF